jgi:hypothetical protein
MSRIFSSIISHYFAAALAGAIFAASGAQAGTLVSLASTEASPQTEQPAQSSTTTAVREAAKESPQATDAEPSKPIPTMHLSKKHAQIIRELHRRGIYW